MKKLFLLLAVLSTSLYAQVDVQLGASVPNGIEGGLGFSSNMVRVGANYGYLHHADAANLHVKVGSSRVYLFGTLNVLHINERGRNAIADALEGAVEERSNATENMPFKRTFTGFVVENEEEYGMTDLGAGGGIGVRFGYFFLEGGVRSTRITKMTDSKVDVFMNNLGDHVRYNPNITVAEKEIALREVENMRVDVKEQLRAAFDETPGKLKLLPEFRIGIRIPIGR